MIKESLHFEAILITGGPGSGKTTLINSLANQFVTHEEVARRVIKQQMELGTNAVPWKDILGFSSLALQCMLKEFPEKGEGVQFFDRGVPDLIAYMNLAKIEVPKEYYRALQELNYSEKAFILPPWKEIYATDNERKETFEDAILVYEAILNTYLDLGFKLIEVPLTSVNQRIGLVKNSLL